MIDLINKILFPLVDVLCALFIFNPEMAKKIKLVPQSWNSQTVRLIYVIWFLVFGYITLEVFDLV